MLLWGFAHECGWMAEFGGGVEMGVGGQGGGICKAYSCYLYHWFWLRSE